MNCKIEAVNIENYKIFYPYIKGIYEHSFGVKLHLSDVKTFLDKGSTILLYTREDRVVGYIRYRTPDNTYDIEKATGQKIPREETIALSDLASRERGCGTIMMNDMISTVHKFIITTPWTDSLIQYYKKFGFRSYYPNNTSYPKVTMFLDNR